MSEDLERRLAALESRLRDVEDRDAIVRVLHVMAQTIDYGDHRGWLDCFTAEIVFEMVEVSEVDRVVRVSHQGKGALEAFIPGHSHAPEHFHKHLVADPVIDLDGDRASCSSYLTRIDKGEQGPYLWSFGRYLDEFRRCDDGAWRVTRRTIEVESRAVPVKAADIGSTED